MKRFYSRFRFMLMTFAFGLASVFMINNLLNHENEIAVDLPKAESSSVFEVITKRNWQGFEEIGHGCGGRNKYGGECSVTGYQNNSFEGVSVSHCAYQDTEELNQEVNLRIKNSVNVLVKPESGQVAKKRIILESAENDEKRFDIITFDEDQRIKIITAKKLEMATEFELWEKLRNEQLETIPR